MEAQGSSGDIAQLLCLGVEEVSEEQHDAKAEAFFQAGEGREEKGAQGQPGTGAVGTEGEGEEINGEEGHFGPGAPGPVGDGDKDGGTRANGLGQEQNEPVAEGTEGQKSVKPEDKQTPLQRLMSTQGRLQELEAILQRSDSSDVPTRENLGRWMAASASRVRNWFKIRRAAVRRNRRRRAPIPEHLRATFECPVCRGARWGERCPFAGPRF
ncbi:homeobox protein Rhox5-like isoform X2 [Grammomys surdaster]|nr:homeobox protein Rhox5-like isoform X2 [Grammomys surdaster]XP_028640120.1 homeobox protein Rhox5-like isoform X2 [Grammomys surdaster]